MQTTVEDKNEPKKLPKPNNAVNVFTTLDTDFFKWWCIFLRPIINLTDREVDVISSFLKHRWELSKHISDPKILDTMLMNDETKKKVMKDCNINLQHFYVIMSTLRKRKIIENNVIHSRLIPNIRPTDNGCFQLLIMFKDPALK